MGGAILVVPAQGCLAEAEKPASTPMFAYVIEGSVELSFASGRKEVLAADDAIHMADEPPTAWVNPLLCRAVVLCMTEVNQEAPLEGRA
jgi:hypothetical protein